MNDTTKGARHQAAIEREPVSSPTLFPNDHLKMMLELMKGGGPELGRRWLAALYRAPAEEREAIVDAIEARILSIYDDERKDQAAETMLHIAEDAVHKEGFTEQVIRSYSAAAASPRATEASERRA